MRSRRLVTVILPLVLLAPIGGVVSTASAAEESTITLTGKPKKGVFYDDIGPKSTPDVVRHRGRLTAANGDPVAEATVTLKRELADGKLGYLETTTDAEGRYQFLSKIEGNATYQVASDHDGNSLTDDVMSGLVRLKAMRDFNAELVQKAEKAIFKGNINPGWEQRLVHWERKKCKRCKWEAVAKQKSGDNGTWKFAGAYPPVGKKWTYRAWIARSDGFVKSYSARLITTTTVADRPVARTSGS